MRLGLKKIFFFLLLFPLAIFSQDDIGITNISIVGAAAGPSLCPNDEVSIDLTFANTKGAPYTLDGKTVRIFTTHTSNATAAFNAVIDNGGRIVPAAGNLILRYPRDFTVATALDLSVHGIYTITASITVLNDDDSSNDVFALNNITAYTPTDSALSSTVAGVSTSTLCEGEAITFEIDSSEVRYSLEDSLVRLSTSLNKYPNTNVEVIGHTDNVGGQDYNQRLSTRRAESVSSILAQNDVSRSRIKAYGRGELEPKMTNETSKGRASNRRVEIIITPLVNKNAKLPNVGLKLSVRL